MASIYKQTQNKNQQPMHSFNEFITIYPLAHIQLNISNVNTPRYLVIWVITSNRVVKCTHLSIQTENMELTEGKFITFPKCNASKNGPHTVLFTSSSLPGFTRPCESVSLCLFIHFTTLSPIS